MSDQDKRTPEELLATLRASADQAMANMGEVARFHGGLLDSLLANGFTREEAFALVTVMFSTWAASTMRSQVSE